MHISTSRIPAGGAPDAKLLAAFGEFRAAFRDLKEASEDTNDEPFLARMDPPDVLLKETPAETIPGVIAKLRRAFIGLVAEPWSDEGVFDDRSPQFEESLGLADMFDQLLWGAIEDLEAIARRATTVSPEMRASLDLFLDAAAQLEISAGGSDEVVSPLCDARIDAMRAIARTPCKSSEDLMAKIYVAYINESGEVGPGPMAWPFECPEAGAEPYVDRLLQATIADELASCSKVVREVEAGYAARLPDFEAALTIYRLATEESESAADRLDEAESRVDEAGGPLPSLPTNIVATQLDVLHNLEGENLLNALGSRLPHLRAATEAKVEEIMAFRARREAAVPAAVLVDLNEAAARAWHRRHGAFALLMRAAARSVDDVTMKVRVLREWRDLDDADARFDAYIERDLERLSG
jgi:hypothetical protein